jgi:hypothetical protein
MVNFGSESVKTDTGIAMALAVSHQSLKVQTCVQSHVSPRGIGGGQSGIGAGFPASTSNFSHHYHSNNDTYSFICHQCYIISSTDSIIK